MLAPSRYVDAWTCLLGADRPRLEPNATCTRDGATAAVGRRDAGAAPTCVCDPGYVGPPVGGACWRRDCLWDVCLSAFPPAARALPPACAAEAAGANGTGFGAKLRRGGREQRRWRDVAAVEPRDWPQRHRRAASSAAVLRSARGAPALACADGDEAAAPGDVGLAARCVYGVVRRGKKGA